jgi:hypothetical protein
MYSRILLHYCCVLGPHSAQLLSEPATERGLPAQLERRRKWRIIDSISHSPSPLPLAWIRAPGPLRNCHNLCNRCTPSSEARYGRAEFYGILAVRPLRPRRPRVVLMARSRLGIHEFTLRAIPRVVSVSLERVNDASYSSMLYVPAAT